jgi:hypothetical protein
VLSKLLSPQARKSPVGCVPLMTPVPSVAREYVAEADIVIPNSAYPVTPETIKEIRDAGRTLGLYNMGATRFSYGFYAWPVDAYLRAQWSFSYDGDSSYRAGLWNRPTSGVEGPTPMFASNRATSTLVCS